MVFDFINWSLQIIFGYLIWSNIWYLFKHCSGSSWRICEVSCGHSLHSCQWGWSWHVCPLLGQGLCCWEKDCQERLLPCQVRLGQKFLEGLYTGPMYPFMHTNILHLDKFLIFSSSFTLNPTFHGPQLYLLFRGEVWIPPSLCKTVLSGCFWLKSTSNSKNR